MSAMPAWSFTRYALVLFAGPIIWALHFLGIYGFAGVVCARPGLQGLLTWGVVGAGLLALAALGAAMLARPRKDAISDSVFLRRVSTGLAWLAAVAIAWETAAVLYFPHCSGSA
jgi:hypothetical protein